MPQDTVVVALARGALESAAAWVLVGLAALFVAVLVVLVLVLGELRKLSKGWSKFVAETTEDAQPLLRHAASAARNLDRAADAVRSEVVRATSALGGIAGGLDDAALHLRKRLAELSALLDLIQSEAEEAVLDAAAKLRIFRRGAGLLHRASKGSAAPEAAQAADAAGDGESGARGGDAATDGGVSQTDGREDGLESDSPPSGGGPRTHGMDGDAPPGGGRIDGAERGAEEDGGTGQK